ncbi:MAG TPA: YggS family pyridoxal phosphate-dependent enzyme [Frankiaceae bacterium]|nr:YggS family pyridoxal phosphate-dependent enzyme [Frankiaceae bacterium]
MSRLDELGERLAAVRARIAAVRDPAEVTLVAVSKTWPASDVLLLHRLGVTDFGESYDQEAAAKAAALRDAGVTPRWHFVGGVQRNKARGVAAYADVVHSVDRAELAEALGRAAARAGRTVDALVQVRFDADSGRSGVAPGEAGALADAVAATDGLRLAGLMCVAPLGEPPRPVFARLREVAEAVRARHPGATTISAGMTGDFEDALAEGANCLRVGTALFGGRGPRLR